MAFSKPAVRGGAPGDLSALFSGGGIALAVAAGMGFFSESSISTSWPA